MLALLCLCGSHRIDVICLFFFFKQKTAYEMRISDWSSDVCSSDLLAAAVDQRLQAHARAAAHVERADALGAIELVAGDAEQIDAERRHVERHLADCLGGVAVEVGALVAAQRGDLRSEEHTSELQSLMRISYAVFCLKKTNKHSIT